MSSDQHRPGRRRPRPIPPPQLPPGPLKDLKDALYGLYTAAGQPTLNEIAADAQQLADELDLPGAPKRDTIARIIGDNEVPPNQHDAVTVAAVLASTAGHDAAVVAEQVRRMWTAAMSAPPQLRLGKPIGNYTAFDLEVHRAIDPIGRQAGSPILPRYVPRIHDARLAQVVDAAVGGRSRLAILVGGSSTGKTRACWEAVRRLPPRWLLWHPIDPGRPQAAADAVAAVGPCTALWLNEVQHYLLTTDQALGERVASGLRELLRDERRGPVLVLGTIWPEYWASLTRPPLPGQPDAYGQARELLTGTEIAVADAFTTVDLDRLRSEASHDIRLAHAAEHADGGRITQYLAGVPDLLKRYHTAPTLAKAVIHVAMDARRLGHPLPIPHGLLAQATPGYVSDHDWDQAGDDWLQQALAYTSAPSHGTPGPVVRIRPRPDARQPAPAEPNYRLADYLEQIGRTERAAVFPPASFWTAVAHTVTDPDVLYELAEQARERFRYHRAAQLYQKAADRGDIGALWALARLLEHAGDYAGAEALYQQAAERGDIGALWALARERERAGDWAGAEALYRQAGGNGNASAPWGPAWEREKARHRAGSKTRAMQAADHGDVFAPTTRVELYQQAANRGDPGALEQLARLRQQADDAEGADRLRRFGLTDDGSPADSLDYQPG